eukprot:c39489_g1_i1.p2 GENE.c39489_g1_i1~~c39489_g1_i1.p2  ORF type:complete len:153 (+),score=24.58 c39489_g1_i1:34-492(+)
MADALGLDWGADKGGKCWECWIVSPCCGNPFNAKEAGMCFALWFCCGLCSFAKLFSYSTNGDECGIVNHCLPACFCGICTRILMRHNLRTKAGVPPAEPKGWAGDVLCPLFCSPCSFCQELRSAPPSGWNFVETLKAKKVVPMVKPMVFLQK